MSVGESQVPKKYRDVIDAEIGVYLEGRQMREAEAIPDTVDIPIEDRRLWLRIPNTICVFADMVGSTRLSAYRHDKSTAGAYQLFTETAVRLFSAFEAPYIDVRGDGAFALFNAGQEYRAIAAAVTFKTFSREEFAPRLRDSTGIDIGAHIGIDQKTLLVRKVGLKRHAGRSDRQNEVWAGKPVNMAAKLAAVSAVDELSVSPRYYQRITSKLVRRSCGCPNGQKTDLWERRSLLNDDRFDFDQAHVLKSGWCAEHGAEYCERIIALD